MSAALRKLKPGVYRARDWLDDDGFAERSDSDSGGD